MPSTSVSPSALSIASVQYARVNGLRSLVANRESLLGWMNSCVSGWRCNVLVRRRAFLFIDRMDRSFTAKSGETPDEDTWRGVQNVPGFLGAIRIRLSIVSGLSHAKDS